METGSSEDALRKIAREIQQQKEVQAAQQKQLRMMTTNPEVEGYEFAQIYNPASMLGGDFYDFVDVSDHEIGLAVGDVSGHGVDAAIIMGMVRKALNIYGRGKSSAKEALSITNADIYYDLDPETFVSVFYGVLDVYTSTIVYARAGHSPPVICHPGGQPAVEEIQSNGMVMGMDRGKRFDRALEEKSVVLAPGEILVQYTDGIPEAPNAAGDPYGEERFFKTIEQLLDRPLPEMLEAIQQDVLKFIGDAERKDDITLFAVKRLSV